MAAETHRFEEITGRDCIPWWHAHGLSFPYRPAHCCGRREVLRRAALKRRPQRPADRPYLYNSWGLRCLDPSCSSRAGVSQLFGRADILWVSVDLNDHIYSNDSVPLPGVTIPPPKFYQGTPWAGRQGRYVITFTGACRKQSRSDRVRSKLRELSRMPATSPLMRIACTEDMRFSGAKQATTIPEKQRFGSTVLADGDSAYYKQLQDSDFALVPHGRARYNYRFSEAVGACAVPVVVADGLTLPFEPLVDWSRASVRISEHSWQSMRSLDDLLRMLPSDPAVVLEMRHRVCAINAAYMWSEMARRDALILAASAHTYIRSLEYLHPQRALPPNWPRKAAEQIWQARRVYAQLSLTGKHPHNWSETPARFQGRQRSLRTGSMSNRRLAEKFDDDTSPTHLFDNKYKTETNTYFPALDRGCSERTVGRSHMPVCASALTRSQQRGAVRCCRSGATYPNPSPIPHKSSPNPTLVPTLALQP